MGTRTYSRRAADGTRRLTALGRQRAGMVQSMSVAEMDEMTVLPQNMVDSRPVTADQIRTWNPEQLRAWRVVKTQAASSLSNNPELRGLRQADDESSETWAGVRNDLQDFLRDANPTGLLRYVESALAELATTGAITREVITANPTSSRSLEPNYQTTVQTGDNSSQYATPIISTMLMLRRTALEIQNGKREIARFGGMRYGVDARFKEGEAILSRALRSTNPQSMIDLSKIPLAQNGI